MLTSRRGLYVLWILVPAVLAVGAYSLKLGITRNCRALLSNADAGLDCPELLELGDQEIGTVATARFTVRNRGGAELRLEGIHTSCSCSVVERESGGVVTKVAAVRVAPGGQAELSARVSVGGRPGEAQHSFIYFETNDPTHPKATIDVVVTRLRGGVVALPSAVMFGAVSVDAAARATFTVFDGTVAGRQVERVESSSPERFAAEYQPVRDSELDSQAAGRHGKVLGHVVVIAKTEQPGLVEGEVRIYLSGEERPPDIVPVRGEGDGPCRT